MSRKLLDENIDNLTRTYFDIDPYAGVSQIVTEQNIAPLLEQNKARQVSGDGPRMDREGAMWHAAHIPDVVWMKWKTEEGIDIFNKDHIEAIKAKLDDPEWRHLRTNNFKLGRGDK